MAEDTQSITIWTNGIVVDTWQDLRMTSGVERFPSDFEIVASKQTGASGSSIFIPGASCKIVYGSQVMLTGYIDRVTETITGNEHVFHISGRSKCMDIIDASAEIESWKGTRTSTTLFALAEELARPYGISVVNKTAAVGFAAPTPEPVFHQFSANLGETAYEILERVARSVGVLVYDNEDGDLVLGRTLSNQSPGGSTMAVLGQNIQSFSISTSADNRFGKYSVVAQPIDNTSDRRHAANQAAGTATRFVRGESIDPGIEPARNRRLYIVGEQFERTATGVSSLAQRRADWEMNRRWGRSQVINLVVDGWSDGGGCVWRQNTQVSVVSEQFPFEVVSWLLAQVTFNKSIKGGTTAELTLMPQEAFHILPVSIAPFFHDRTGAALEAATIVRGQTPGATP